MISCCDSFRPADCCSRILVEGESPDLQAFWPIYHCEFYETVTTFPLYSFFVFSKKIPDTHVYRAYEYTGISGPTVPLSRRRSAMTGKSWLHPQMRNLIARKDYLQ